MTPEVVAALAGVLVMTGALVAAMPRVPVVEDEAWFLQVVARHHRGDVLYRDVFYGAGPLPVYIASLAVRGRRKQMFALRVLNVIYHMSLLVAGSWVLGEAGAPAMSVVVLWVASLAFAPPTLSLDSHYTRLALVAAVVAAGVALHIGPAGSPVDFTLAGVAAGVSFSAKQTIGIAASIGAIALAAGAGGLAGGAWCVLGAVAVTAAGLAPIARAGALRWYVRRAFLNKTSYLATGRMGIRAGIREPLMRTFPNRFQQGIYALVVVATYLVLPATLIACGGLLRSLVADSTSATTRLVDGTALALGAVVAAAAIPRADLSHVRSLFPVGLVTVALAVESHPSAVDSIPDGAHLPVVVVSLVIIALALVIPVRRLQVAPTSGGPSERSVRPFEGLPVIVDSFGGPEGGAALRELTGGRVFLLRSDASFWYLAGGLENPTPYDYPLASVFGPHGQQEVIEGIIGGHISWVCWPGPSSGRLRPAALEEFVSRAMVAVEETPAGTLYRMREPSTGAGPEAPRS